MKPKAAPNRWPYLEHRTMAEIMVERMEFDALDQLSRFRALSPVESSRLERLMKVAA